MNANPNSLLQPLIDGPLDIVGDVHGEWLALRQLLAHLGYDLHGEHPLGRRLVFVGDLCDRGSDSPAVIGFVEQLVERHLAQCVLGNHELNILRQERKTGNGWFFERHPDHDRPALANCRRASTREREDIVRFFASLPAALHRSDLRITHAAWHEPAIEQLRDAGAPPSTLTCYREFESRAQSLISADLRQAAAAEKRQWAAHLQNPKADVPLLANLANEDAIYQSANPLRVVTSGLESPASKPFFASGKWRMVERVPWWQNYLHRTPVIVGHYWRWWDSGGQRRYSRGEQDLFAGIDGRSWMGAQQQVYCVDFSVGARFREISDGIEPGRYTRLGALRWPDNELVFDNGERFALRDG
jgi:hypothetical protein